MTSRSDVQRAHNRVRSNTNTILPQQSLEIETPRLTIAFTRLTFVFAACSVFWFIISIALAVSFGAYATRQESHHSHLPPTLSPPTLPPPSRNSPDACTPCANNPDEMCQTPMCVSCPSCVSVVEKCKELNTIPERVNTISNVQAVFMMCVDKNASNETAFWVGSQLFFTFRSGGYAIVDRYKAQASQGSDQIMVLLESTYNELFEYTFNFQNALGNLTNIFSDSSEASKYFLEQGPYATRIHNTILNMNYLAAKQSVKIGNNTKAWEWMRYAALDISKIWGNGITGWMLATYTTGLTGGAIIMEGDETVANLRLHLESLLFPAIHVWPGAHANLAVTFEFFRNETNLNGLTADQFYAWNNQFNDLGRLYSIHSCILMYYYREFPQLFLPCPDFFTDPGCYQVIPGSIFVDQASGSVNRSDDLVFQSIRVPYIKPVGNYLYDKHYRVVDPSFEPIPAIRHYLAYWTKNQDILIPTTPAETRWIRQAKRSRGFSGDAFVHGFESSPISKCPFFQTALSRGLLPGDENFTEYNKNIIDILYGGNELKDKACVRAPLVCRFANREPRSSWDKAVYTKSLLREMKFNFTVQSAEAANIHLAVNPSPTGVLYPRTAFPVYPINETAVSCPV